MLQRINTAREINQSHVITHAVHEEDKSPPDDSIKYTKVFVLGKCSNNESFSMGLTEYRIPGTVCLLYSIFILQAFS